MSLVEQVLKAFDEMEEERTEEYTNILESFRSNLKDTGSQFYYHMSIIYDEVRQWLEDEGISVSVVAYNKYSLAYLITKKSTNIILR